MKIYIAGPMTGMPRFNFRAFHAAEKQLHETADTEIEIHNPAAEDEKNGFTPAADSTGHPEELVGVFCIRTAMQRNCNAICQCTHIYMLRGWENSTGSQAEHALARVLGLTIWYQ